MRSPRRHALSALHCRLRPELKMLAPGYIAGQREILSDR
jgi:hypothetical protein